MEWREPSTIGLAISMLTSGGGEAAANTRDHMRVLGIANSSSALDWACVDGNNVDDLHVNERGKVEAPPSTRSEQLAWVRRELLELVDRHRPDRLAVQAAVKPRGSGSLSVGRVEAQGVLLAAAGESGLDCKLVYGATVRSAFGVAKKQELQPAIAQTPAIAAVPKTRREPVIAALCGIVK